MKKTVLVYGSIAGVIVSAMMAYSVYHYCQSGDFEGGMIYGYTMMLISFSMIFVGVKTFRDKQNGGVIGFWKAAKIGFLIAFLASTIYVLIWLFESHYFYPDFMEKYSAHMIEKLQASGVSAAKIAEETTKMNQMKEMYKNPIFKILITYVEILPIGVLVTLITALVLKRKNVKPRMA